MELNERVNSESWLAVRGDIRRAWGVLDEDEYDDVMTKTEEIALGPQVAKESKPTSEFRKRYGTNQLEIIESVIDVHEALSK